MNDERYEIEFVWGHQSTLPFLVDRVTVRCGMEESLRRFVLGIINSSPDIFAGGDPGIRFSHNGSPEESAVSWLEMNSLMFAWGFLREDGNYYLIVRSPWQETSGAYFFRDRMKLLTMLYGDMKSNPTMADLAGTYHLVLGVPMPESTNFQLQNQN